MGRRNRRNVNADDFTTPEMAQEANNAATRDAVSMDVYGTQTTFQAIVLTEPVPMSTSQIGDLYGTSRDDGAQVLPRFQFKGRIVGGDLPSPHHYLPDPCRLDLSINTQTTLDLISMHTTFISEVGYSGGRPSVGDAVEVELEAGDVKFNLQYGTFKGIVNSAQISSPQRSAECVSLAAKLRSTSNLRTLRGSTVGNIREREVVGGIEEQVVTIRGTHIRNPNNRKAKPEAIAWLNAVLAAVNRRLAAGETSTSDVPHATRTDSNGRLLETGGCNPARNNRTGMPDGPWTFTITSAYRDARGQDIAMQSLRKRTIPNFRMMYAEAGPSANNLVVTHRGGMQVKACKSWGGWNNVSCAQRTTANGSSLWGVEESKNYSEALAELRTGGFTGEPRVVYPPSRIRSGCSNTTEKVKCQELRTWLRHFFPNGISDQLARRATIVEEWTNTGAVQTGMTNFIRAGWWIPVKNQDASDVFNQPIGTIIANPVAYHISQIYGDATWVREWLKLDYAQGGSDECTAIIQRAMDRGWINTSRGHTGGMAFDVSVATSNGAMSNANARDFVIDVIANSLNEPELRAANVSRGRSFYHDNHLHFDVPPGAVNLL